MQQRYNCDEVSPDCLRNKGSFGCSFGKNGNVITFWVIIIRNMAVTGITFFHCVYINRRERVRIQTL
jgi:hypothetical protein